tara:strand:- start:14250 stop:14675 length:426 start_codon:yes stop_codon:yes gene_type:complete
VEGKLEGKGKEGNGTYKILSAGKTSRKLEFMRHVRRLHDFIRPLAIHIVELVDLEPACALACRRRRVVDGEQEVRDGAWVARRVPLHFDRVACGGFHRGDGAAVSRRHVAGHVGRGDIHDGRVGGRHPDADLVAGRLVVDP